MHYLSQGLKKEKKLKNQHKSYLWLESLCYFIKLNLIPLSLIQIWNKNFQQFDYKDVKQDYLKKLQIIGKDYRFILMIENLIIKSLKR